MSSPCLLFRRYLAQNRRRLQFLLSSADTFPVPSTRLEVPSSPATLAATRCHRCWSLEVPAPLVYFIKCIHHLPQATNNCKFLEILMLKNYRSNNIDNVKTHYMISMLDLFIFHRVYQKVAHLEHGNVLCLASRSLLLSSQIRRAFIMAPESQNCMRDSMYKWDQLYTWELHAWKLYKCEM